MKIAPLDDVRFSVLLLHFISSLKNSSSGFHCDKSLSIHSPGGGGGHSTFQVDGGGGGVPLGFENLTLSQCARRTQNTPCHNIPYKKLAF